MADLFVAVTSPVAPRSIAERQAARRAVAGYATDTDDLRELFDCLGLWPAGDAEARSLTPTPSWDGSRK